MKTELTFPNVTLKEAEKLNAYLTRLRGGGCVAVDCSAGRGADQDQATAEQRSVGCERDTDGDGDCGLCWNKGGCQQYLKDQADKSGVSGAALVPPEKAEDIVWGWIRRQRVALNRAAKEAEKGQEHEPTKGGESALRATMIKHSVIDDLVSCLSESRKANDAEALERGMPKPSQTQTPTQT